MRHWQPGDVALLKERSEVEMRDTTGRHVCRVPGYVVTRSVRIVEIMVQTSLAHMAMVQDIDIGSNPFAVSLSRLECDPELTLKQAGDWRLAGGRVGDR